MKKLAYYSIVSLSLAGLMSSCELDAPSKSALDSQVIYSTPSLAEAAVMGIHQSFGETNSYRGRFLPYYGINTDIEWLNSIDVTKLSDDDKYSLCTYTTSPTNKQMNTENNAYAKFYEGIERANLAIQGLRAYGKGDAALEQLLGEALTLRAVLYLDLIKGWGDVPARFEPISSETMYLERTNRAVIYQQLLDDLKVAEDLVAWPNETAVTKSTERVSKAFVKGLRARIALYAGGYYYKAGNAETPILDRTEMYTIAKKECIDVIEKRCNNLGEFKQNFLNLSKDITTAGQESLWEIPFSDGRGRVLYTFGVAHAAADQYTKQPRGGYNGPLPTLYYDYDVDDVRRDITCVPYGWSKDLVDGKSHQELRSVAKWCFGKLRYEWMNRIVTSTNDDGVNWQYMRLADVYLMAAEAVNELDGPKEAAQYMKPVLDRALPAAKVEAYLTSAKATKEAFFNAIVDQRAFEFAGESLRKADLIRWGLLTKKMSEAKAKMTQLQQREGKYADLPANLYWRIEDDGETLDIYGLNHGDTDEAGAALTGYDKKSWITDSNLKSELINALYVDDPDQNQTWPIWKTFIDSSNGMLSND